MPRRVRKGAAVPGLKGDRLSQKGLQKTLRTVERTSRLIRSEAGQMTNLAKVLDHWGDLIKVTEVMGRAVRDSEKWVNEIQLAIQAMTKRTVYAAKKLRAIISAHETNGT